MKTIEFRKDSWYYKMVDKTTGYFDKIQQQNYYREESAGKIKPDICSFTRAFLWGAIKILVAGSFGLYLALALILGLLTIVLKVSGVTLVWLAALQIPISIGCTFIGVFIALTAIVSVIHLVVTLTTDFVKSRKQKAKTTGPIKTMFRHWKDKTCALIEFK